MSERGKEGDGDLYEGREGVRDRGTESGRQHPPLTITPPLPPPLTPSPGSPPPHQRGPALTDTTTHLHAYTCRHPHTGTCTHIHTHAHIYSRAAMCTHAFFHSHRHGSEREHSNTSRHCGSFYSIPLRLLLSQPLPRRDTARLVLTCSYSEYF